LASGRLQAVEGRTRRRLGASVAALVCCLAATPAPAVSEESGALRRFALVVGNNEGGEGTRPLMYAAEDARKFHNILLRLGGVRREDTALVLGGTAEEVLRALTALERKAADSSRRGQRTALYVYYSGHAKDGALLLGRTRIPFAALKNRLAQAPADVRVGIFDACQSGALTRRKGARRVPDFDVQSDAAQGARGLVILTSSAADEDSQESDLLGGSYFSHHLASGLLGDADRSADGRVSLSEAYAYAYERTLADTSGSTAGAQHPTYSYDFQGNGDLVLTDLVDRKEGLYFPVEAPGGVYFVVDERGFVVAEVWKAEARASRIAVPPGGYRLSRRLESHLRVAELAVASGKLTRVEDRAMRDVPFSDDPVKGVGRASYRSGVMVSLSGAYQSFFDRPTREDLFPSVGMAGLDVQLLGFFRRSWSWGFDLHFGAGERVLRLDGVGVGLPYLYGQLTAGSSITAEWPLGPWAPFMGGRLALMAMSRDFRDEPLPRQSFVTLSPGVVGGVRYQFAPSWSASACGRVHYLLYQVDENRSLGYWELTASVGYEL
jgi:Caspase domain